MGFGVVAGVGVLVDKRMHNEETVYIISGDRAGELAKKLNGLGAAAVETRGNWEITKESLEMALFESMPPTEDNAIQHPSKPISPIPAIMAALESISKLKVLYV